MCAVEGCETRGRLRRGWCEKHYYRWKQHGDPNKVLKIFHEGTESERFWAKVNKTGDCWLWTGWRTNGYGRFTTNGKNWRAHRFAFEEMRGPIPEGLQLDHLCRVRHCVNPDHLEPVTRQQNMLRAWMTAVS